MDKDKSKLFILLIVLVIAIIIRVIFDTKETSEITNTKYVIIDNYLIVSVFQDNVREVDDFPNELLKSKLNVFIGGKYFGNYYVKNINDTIKIYDEDNNSVTYNGSLIVNNFDSNMRVSNVDFEEFSTEDYSITKSVLEDEGISIGIDTSTVNCVKYKADFNNDGMDEYIYSISNMYSDAEEAYSILFTYYDNKYTIISKDIDKGFNGYELSILSILDINSDGELDIIVGKSKYGNPTECYEIYKSDNMKFKKIKGCK